MKKFLKSSVNTIFIMLGRKCNFNCRYCLQLNTKENLKDLPNEINEDIYDFIEELANSQEEDLTLHFYGGEPLIYLNKIKDIVQGTEHLKNIRYSIITNGSLITEHTAEYLNEHKFEVGVSWDGYQSIETRKKDIVKTNSNNLLKINNLGLNGVVSHFAYPKQMFEDMQEFDNRYRAIHNKHIGTNLEEVFDTCLNDRILLDVDYDRVRSEMKELTELTLKHMNNQLEVSPEEYNSKYYTKTYFMELLISQVKYFVKHQNKFLKKVCNCGNGYWVLNMDLEGNLYNCHNDDIILGNIYSNFFEYLEAVREYDHTAYFYDTACKDCYARVLCGSGCKLMTEKVRNETYCKLKKAMYEPIIDEIIRYSKTSNDSVSEVKEGTQSDSQIKFKME